MLVSLLLLGLAVIVGFFLLRTIPSLVYLAGSRLARAVSRVVPPEEIPDEIRARLAEESIELPALGFVPVCVLHSDEMEAREDRATWLGL